MNQGHNGEELLSLVVACLSFVHFSDTSKSLLLDSLCLIVEQGGVDVRSGVNFNLMD